MQKQLFKAATISSLLVALTISFAAVSVSADSYTSIEVNVPFEFTAGNNVLPAGKYSIRSTGSNTSSIVRISSKDEKSTVLLPTLSARTVQSKEKTVVIFHRYGDQYFLYQVWAVGDISGLEVPKSSKEKRAVRSMQSDEARAGSGPEEIVIVANNR